MARDRAHEAVIADVDLFRDLSKAQLKRLAGAASEVLHPPGKAVATEGGGALAFHLIIEGSATVSKDGHELRTLGPGDYFGEISMIDGRPRSATVTALEGLTVMAIPHRGGRGGGADDRRGSGGRPTPPQDALRASARGRGTSLELISNELGSPPRR